MEPTLNTELLTRCLDFHGQQLQRLWESERGEGDLAKHGIDPKDLEFNVHQQRQKLLSFQDRGKRLKLQQFIVKRAAFLFDPSAIQTDDVKERAPGDEDCYAIMPPYETFVAMDKPSRQRHFFQNIKKGDFVICTINTKNVLGMMLKVLCTDGDDGKYAADLNVKAFCPHSKWVPPADKKALNRSYAIGETVCCEVLEVIPDTEKLVVGMQGVTLPPDSEQASRLGLILPDDFPEVYKKAQDTKGDNYQKILEKSLGFANPNNINYLSNMMGLGSVNYSFMSGMRERFPEPEYATELRQVQASKWAFRSVAEGIEHFKSGRHSEAFQCLNKALNIDPRNVEGLVARGALYANSGSFQKAIEDFETALKLNPNHQNARKYMGETLVALGRSFEDENKFEDALKAYENCLSLIPFHEEAQNSIEFLKNKILNSSKLSEGEVSIPGLSTAKTSEVKETLKQLLKSNDEEEKKDDKKKTKKKKDRKSRKRRHRSSSSSSSSSSASSHSSSSSSSSSSDTSSGSSHSGSHSHSRSPSRSRKSSKKHRKGSRKKDDKREKSLSPLSKRMALMDPTNEVEGLGGLLAQRASHYNPPALPFSFARNAFQVAQEPVVVKDDYEQRVCRFLEQTKGDSEYEEKVRKFLEESARWKKERKVQEEKTKKKKKKDKKSRDKDKSKKKKRDRDEHEKKKKHRSKRSDKFDAKEFEEQMESKKFRDALRKELSTTKEDLRKRKSIDDEEEFLYGPSGDKKGLRLLGLDNIPDLEDLESKLSAYYAKVEKDTGLAKTEEKAEKEKKRHSSSPGKSKQHISPKVMFVHHEDPKVEESLRIREKKKMDMFAESPSPPHAVKGKPAQGEPPTVMSSKWKMQIGSVSTRIKKKDKAQTEKEPWDEVEEKRFIFIKDDPEKGGSDDEGEVHKKKTITEDKFSSRKIRDGSDKLGSEKLKKEFDEAREDSIAKTQQFVDKFQGGFRINSRTVDKKSEDLPPLPPGVPPSKTSFTISGSSKTGLGGMGSSGPAKGPRTDSDSDSSGSDKRKKKKPLTSHPKGASSRESSRSRSRSRGKYSRGSSTNSSRSRSYPKNRSRSKSGSYDRRRSRSGSYGRYGSRSRSRSYPRYRSSGSRSRSHSYRSRSRSYDRYSRSRSRSDDYHRRSRSESDDRRRKHDYHMNKYQGRYPRNRGTYYRPRFQNFKNQRGGFQQRGNRNFHQKYQQNRGNRPYGNRGRGRGGRGRYFHYKPSSGYKDYHSRRYDRPRSRGSDDRRSYSREDDDPMKKVDAAKEKINKYIADENKKDEAAPSSSKSRDEPLSEGEAVDDDDYSLPPLPSSRPPSRDSSYVDRKTYDGKWAEKESDDKGSRSKGSDGSRLPPENSIEEMDKFLNKVKTQKKEDVKDRNKSFTKSNW